MSFLMVSKFGPQPHTPPTSYHRREFPMLRNDNSESSVARVRLSTNSLNDSEKLYLAQIIHLRTGASHTLLSRYPTPKPLENPFALCREVITGGRLEHTILSGRARTFIQPECFLKFMMISNVHRSHEKVWVVARAGTRVGTED